jgi:predicted DNA-binding transcriptional regulator YafY
MANTSSRTLRLLSLLQTHRFWPGPELADRLGVSARTLRRDVDRLRELGYPVDAHRGTEGGYQLAAGAALPPLVVDDEEAVALAVGMQAVAQGAVPGVEEAGVRALTKVVQVMPPRLRRRVEALRAVTTAPTWGTAPVLDPDVLTTLAQACRDDERIEFGYTTYAGDQAGRLVEPHRLVPLGRRWYLVAYDLHRHDWRSFRLDRLDGPRGVGARFQPRALPADDAAAFVRAGIRNLPTTHEVEVLFAAPVEAVRVQVGRWVTVEDAGEEPGGVLRSRMRMSTDSLDWAALAVGVVRAEFTVVAPPALREHLREWGARFVRAAG